MDLRAGLFPNFRSDWEKHGLGHCIFPKEEIDLEKETFSDLLISESIEILGINDRNGRLNSQGCGNFGKITCSGDLNSKFREIPGRDNGFGQAFSKRHAFIGKGTHSVAVFSNANPSEGYCSLPAAKP